MGHEAKTGAKASEALLARVGDLVVCRDPIYRDALKLPDELGLVLDARKDRAKVYLPQSRGEPWIPTQALARVRQPVGDANVPPWMQRAYFLARSLDMLFMEVTHVGADGCALRLFHGETELDRFDSLRALLGDELRYWRLLPAGLHKIESAVAFVPRERADPPHPLPSVEA
jgi:hypothetical protein